MLNLMSNTLSANDLEFDGPAVYRIRVRGRRATPVPQLPFEDRALHG